jgi:hypothetical protein
MPKTNSKFPTLHQWGLGEMQNGFFKENWAKIATS